METLAHWLGPLHPPATHFPIVCSILAALAFAIGGRKKEEWLLKSASALWILTFLSAVASLVFGHLFAFHLGLITDGAAFPPPPEALKGQLRFHALLGIAATLLSILTFIGACRLISGRAWPFSIQLVSGIALAVLFAVTGHEGGEMVYGSDENPKAASPSIASTAADGGLFTQIGDYRRSLFQMNARSWNSRTHGHRWVNTFVSKEAVSAYKNSNPLPEGTWVVKESFEDEGGKASQTPGPLYVMHKGKVSDSPETGGWQYALRWDKPVTGNPEDIQGPVTWLPGDPNLSSCIRCHNHFKDDDYMGGVPSDAANP